LNRNTEMHAKMVETVYEDYTRLKDDNHPKLTSNLLEYLPAILDALLNTNCKSYKYFAVRQIIRGPQIAGLPEGHQGGLLQRGAGAHSE
jgi:hypothetical protein